MISHQGTFQYMVVYYEDYANFFKNNFKLETLFENSQYTFPMWGFGIMILLFKKKIGLYPDFNSVLCFVFIRLKINLQLQLQYD